MNLLQEIKYSSYSTRGYRESTDLEERVKKLLYRVPSQRPITQEQLNQLNGMPIGDRLEMNETVRIVLDNLIAHVQDLQLIETILKTKPNLQSSAGLNLNDIEVRDIISLWENNQRVSYYVVSKWASDSIISTVKLKKNGKIDGRVQKGSSSWSHQFGPVKLRLARLEKKNVNPKDIGADKRLVDRWIEMGKTGIMQDN